jgi:hypothetical protein
MTPGSGPEGSGDGDQVRDLGEIDAHEVPGTSGPVDPHTVWSGPAPSSPPTVDPDGRPLPARRGSVGDELRQAVEDIRRVQRRGSVPNSRPLPPWVGRLAWFLDDAFAVPGTAGRRVGVDGMLTFVPVVGDLAGMGLSMIVVLAGVAAGVSIPTTLRMLLNVGLESLVGLIPFGGALFDMVYKANNRNVRLIERDLADRRATRRSSALVLFGAVLTIVIGILMAFFLVFAGIFLVVAFFTWLLG